VLQLLNLQIALVTAAVLVLHFRSKMAHFVLIPVLPILLQTRVENWFKKGF